MSEFTLKIAFDIFVWKLLDPFAAVPALIVGYFCRAWWQVVIAAAAVGIIVEMILVALGANARNSRRAALDGRAGGGRVGQPRLCLQNVAREARGQNRGILTPRGSGIVAAHYLATHHVKVIRW